MDEKDAYGQDRLVPMQPAGTYRPLSVSSVAPSASLSAPIDTGKATAHSEAKGHAVCHRARIVLSLTVLTYVIFYLQSSAVNHRTEHESTVRPTSIHMTGVVAQ